MSTPQPPTRITAIPLTKENFSPYGDVISALSTPSQPANQGTAQRFNHLANLTNLRPDAKPNLCVFKCQPTPQLPFKLTLLERHKYSSQVFIPMTPPNGARAYLVIVALNDCGRDKPDWGTLKAFIADTTQGINYREGCWHCPMVALEKETDFGCLVWECGGEGDCEEVAVEGGIVVEVEGFVGAGRS